MTERLPPRNTGDGRKSPSPQRVGAGIGNSTYLLVGAIWIVVTTVIVVSVRDVRDFRLRPSLPEPDLAASVPAS